MKIAYIAAGAGAMICGNCLRDNTLAAALIELGHDVRLIPTYTPIRTDEEDVSLDRIFYGGINVFLQQKIGLFRHTPWLLDRLLDRPGLLRWASKFVVKTRPEDLGQMTVSVLQGAGGAQRKELHKLIDWLKADPPDVVHLTNSMFAGMAAAIKNALKIPVCCSLQGEDYFLENLPASYSEQAFSVLSKMAKSVDMFISPSRDHAAAMAPRLGIPEGDIRVVASGLNLKDLKPAPKSNPEVFRIGYLARVCPEKGLALLAEAFHLIRNHREAPGPRVQLHVAGWLGPEHHSYLQNIQRQVDGWGLGEDFKYLGGVNRAEKVRFLQRLDVLSVPAAYRAAKGLYVLEALACGVPVVQPRLGVFPELIEATSGGLLFEPENAVQLARSIESLIDNRAESERMGRAGREAVSKQFHSRRMAQEMQALYETMVDPKSGGWSFGSTATL